MIVCPLVCVLFLLAPLDSLFLKGASSATGNEQTQQHLLGCKHPWVLSPTRCFPPQRTTNSAFSVRGFLFSTHCFPTPTTRNQISFRGFCCFTLFPTSMQRNQTSCEHPSHLPCLLLLSLHQVKECLLHPGVSMTMLLQVMPMLLRLPMPPVQ